MKSINYNSGWEYWPKHTGSFVYSKNELQAINLPHDFSILDGMDKDSPSGSSGGFFSTASARYSKHFEADSSWIGKSILLEFDGIYFNSSVFINNQLVAKHPYGYTAFICDLTQFVIPGDNEIRIDVAADMMPNSRWYSGCGMYRDVTLHIGEGLIFAPWDVSITTPDIEILDDGLCNATIHIDGLVTGFPWLRANLANGGNPDSDITAIFDGKGVRASIAGIGDATVSICASNNTLVYDVEPVLASDVGSDNSSNVCSDSTSVTDKKLAFAGQLNESFYQYPDDPRYRPCKAYFTADIFVENASLWSVESPLLHELTLELLDMNKDAEIEPCNPAICSCEAIDTTTITFGIRKIEFSAKEGFKLNGVPRKIKGGCVHHDCGILGSAAFKRAEERKIELLKASGYDGVRCAHNPPSASLLEACDRLGMLVIDEAFDCWQEGKNAYDYNLFFEKYWRDDISRMILRDRNHPSVIMWSIGNEINERDGKNYGYKTSALLADFARSIDSTRPITMALCIFWSDEHSELILKNKLSVETGKTNRAAQSFETAFSFNDLTKYTDFSKDVGATNVDGANGTVCDDGIDYGTVKYKIEDVHWGEMSEAFAAPLDVVGYNYLNWRYEIDHKIWPNRIICGTETFPLHVFDYWESTLKNESVIGDFVWTSLDYLGESGLGRIEYDSDRLPRTYIGEYPWNQAFCGDIDVCGFKRPQSFYRDCVWGISTKPYIAVYPPNRYDVLDDPKNVVSPWGWHDVSANWTWPDSEDTNVRVEVYSTDDEIELFINNESCGKKACGVASKYIATFNTTYRPGEVKAVGYRDGKKTGEQILVTAAEPAKIRLTPDRTKISADIADGDLSFVTIELLDVNGNIVSNSNSKISVFVEGGHLQALGSSNPITDEGYVSNHRKLCNGRAMAVILPINAATIKVTALTADGRFFGSCDIQAE